jgi:hypothetical protein
LKDRTIKEEEERLIKQEERLIKENKERQNKINELEEKIKNAKDWSEIYKNHLLWSSSKLQDMNKKTGIFENTNSNEVEIREELRNYRGSEYFMTAYATINKKYVGHCDYSLYKDEIWEPMFNDLCDKIQETNKYVSAAESLTDGIDDETEEKLTDGEQVFIDAVEDAPKKKKK